MKEEHQNQLQELVNIYGESFLIKELAIDLVGKEEIMRNHLEVNN